MVARSSNKAIKKVIKGVKNNRRPFKIDLDLCNVPVVFSAHLVGNSNAKEDRLSITVFDNSGKYIKPLGAFRIRRADWARFKRTGNQLLTGHARAVQHMKQLRSKKKR